MKSIFKEICPETGKKRYLTQTVSIPVVNKNEVLVQVKACSLSEINEKIQRNLVQPTSNKLSVGTDIAGVVKEIGSEVSTISVGDAVVGVIPLDYNSSGCAEFVVLDEFELTKKPNGVSFVDAAGCVGDAVKAYTALRYLGHLQCGNTVLMMDGATCFGSLVIQLVHHWGAKIICVANTDDEKLYLNGMDVEPALILDMTNKNTNMRNMCLEETGSLGVDIIIDNGCNDDSDFHHDIISTLSIGGRWITSNPNLQLDPPHSKLLFLKGASVCFLFEQTWILSSSKQGRYQHILNDVLDKLSSGVIRPNIHHSVPFESTVEALKHLSDNKVGKIVMTF